MKFYYFATPFFYKTFPLYLSSFVKVRFSSHKITIVKCFV